MKKQEAGMHIGFVPTMGALHEGHLSLIEQAKKYSDLVVCSIFVNPLQFNRKEDLVNYPKRIVEDTKLLEGAGCNCLFIPEVEEVYPQPPKIKFDFGSIGVGMEADYRPGHFNGVAAVIDRFFKILNPDFAFFGEKDFQQLAIVRWLVHSTHSATQIIPCNTKRYNSGLAMSSRNFRLNESELAIAAKIYQALSFALENKEILMPEEIISKCKSMLAIDFSVDYFQIADENTMLPLKSWSDSNHPRAFVAAYLNGIRLIDNLSLID